MKPPIPYSVDDDEDNQTTTEEYLTPTQILTNFGLDATQHYLKELQGNHQISFEGKPDEPIHMHPHLKFISIFTGSTPVSALAS